MTTFDPDTGLRVVPEPVSTGSVARAPRNPYDRALGIIWITAVVLSITLLFIGAGLQQTDTGGGACFVMGATVAVVGLIAGLVHLGARAAGWRPPED